MDIGRWSLFALWVAVLLNLILTVRILAWLRVLAGIQPAPTAPPTELRVGTTAPAFRAVTRAGEAVTEQTYAGRQVTFFFLSPECSSCRSQLPILHKIAPAAAAAGVDLVLVLDVGAGRAGDWLTALEREDGVRVTLPVLLAPISRNSFIPSYSAGYFPYFCMVDGDGTVRARGVVNIDLPEWRAVVARWIPPPAPAGSRAPRAGSGEPPAPRAGSGAGPD